MKYNIRPCHICDGQLVNNHCIHCGCYRIRVAPKHWLTYTFYNGEVRPFARGLPMPLQYRVKQVIAGMKRAERKRELQARLQRNRSSKNTMRWREDQRRQLGL